MTNSLASGWTRRGALALAAGSMAAGLPWPARSQDMTFFRIATGGTAGTYYPVGALIANVISNPPGSRACEDGGSCGVPGLVATAQSSEGSVANIEAIVSGQVESGFCQSDVVFWVYNGTGIFEGAAPKRNLRLIGSLYPEVVQIVVRHDSGIRSIPDMAGRRISLGAEGSGTLVDARIILDYFGLSDSDIGAEYVKHGPSVTMLREGDLDGFFVIAGYPTNSVFDLVQDGIAEVLPIPSGDALQILIGHPFFSLSAIPEGTYPGQGHASTLAIGAQWIVSPDVPDDLVYGIAAALWHGNSRALLDSGHPAARQLKLENALLGASIPLHPGARAYYEEAGLDLADVPLPVEGDDIA
ncbi:MAG: TAXI family TRAP transporter solute-binding subunit [Rhodospirillales bacterium]|nr:TAXI family TRAP transporter solute-binding subunit [Rhodospirillales bacterium]